AYRIFDLSVNFTIVSVAVILIIHYVMKQYSAHSKDLYLASITDSLTGLYNRRYFTEFIHAEYNRATRTGQHFSMILLDLNHFKKINDTYGHMTGDKVLIAISGIIKKCLRSYDIAARYGGDEFVIILPSTEKPDAILFMKRLETEFDKYCVQYKKEQFAVAFGIEDSKDKSLDDLYRETDNNLYTNKAELKKKNEVS
ncbi:MAG: GGDEF domain-containing protein, partial [Lachnospiraceae bacterium]|nr:GGDEF domain-containing protein [Lachnospiraceae bacterium]